MPVHFDFDPKKAAHENIDDFLSHIEANYPFFPKLLRMHMDKMLPLPNEPSKRSTARTAFNDAIKKQLDALLSAKKAKRA